MSFRKFAFPERLHHWRYPPHPPFKNSVLLWNPDWPWTSIAPTSVFWVLDTMMDFQMTANICKTLAPVDLLQNWSFFTPDSWTQMTFPSFPDRWELFRSRWWERMHQRLVILGELPSTIKEGIMDVSASHELPVVIAGFSFWPGMDFSRQQTKQLFFPSCVSPAQSSCLHLAEQADGVRWKWLTNCHGWLLTTPSTMSS